jgi:hypothetical protein
VELAAGEELESRAEGAVVDEDTDELLHDRFGVFHEFGEPAAHLLPFSRGNSCGLSLCGVGCWAGVSRGGPRLRNYSPS